MKLRFTMQCKKMTKIVNDCGRKDLKAVHFSDDDRTCFDKIFFYKNVWLSMAVNFYLQTDPGDCSACQIQKCNCDLAGLFI